MAGKKVKQGWKPGAVTKKMLRMLNQAKLRKSKIEATKPTRRAKKQIEDKPVLKVSKRNGEYRVEMQVTNNEDHNEQYKPLVYKIESTNNKTKMKQKERIRKKLVRDAVKNVWSDRYHPEFNQVCLKAYKEAIGFEDSTYRNREDDDRLDTISRCSYEEVSLSNNSSEVDWEIHFTPPLMCYQTKQQKEEDLLQS